jgi:methyltransferase (TIGR00027 family)/uncharacterized protein (TIGR02118 family)
MIKISVFYPNEKSKKFDKEYFLKTHMPFMEKVWGASLKKREIDIGISGQGPAIPPPYVAIVHLYFDSLQDIQAAMGPQHQELMQQTSNFTDSKPLMQLSMVASDPSSVETIEEKPSQTAAYVAICRALSFRDLRAEIRGPDSLAHLFIPDEAKKSLESADSIKRGIAFSGQIFGLLVARTAYFDAKFTDAIAQDIKQIVLLGAGYDTRAYRFSSLLNGATIYEMDIGSTQGRKLDILRKAAVGIPPQVRYVSINFKTENIKDVLLKNGFDVTIPSVFLWEGVTYYLTEDIFRVTLSTLKSIASKGSFVCFDYQTMERESGRAAEPFQFWTSPESLAEQLSIQGISIIEQIDPQEMEKRYLSLTDGTVAEKAFDVYRFVYAALN